MIFIKNNVLILITRNSFYVEELIRLPKFVMHLLDGIAKPKKKIQRYVFPKKKTIGAKRRSNRDSKEPHMI